MTSSIYSTIISPVELSSHLEDPQWVIVDCRSTLSDPELGRQQYLQAHIRGAVYAHLDAELSSPVIPGVTGRHPAPSIASAVELLSSRGIDAFTQVVAYDDWPVPGGIAARLWWMLRWLGHSAVAVLDGGWNYWQAGGFPVGSGLESRPRKTFIPHVVRPELAATSGDVDRLRQDPTSRVIDSRTADRYRGENETIDPVAGHIPGARLAPYVENIGSDGFFRSPEELRARFEKLLEGVPAERTVFYCGSGVTAAHNLLAVAHAGLGSARLYVGSWSEWITDPARPVEK